eukprot:1474266-Pleurochrysis_carterae.AAC.7
MAGLRASAALVPSFPALLSRANFHAETTAGARTVFGGDVVVVGFLSERAHHDAICIREHQLSPTCAQSLTAQFSISPSV